MPSNSEYHGYEIPDDGEQNWGDPLQRTLQALDRDTVIRRATASDIKAETPTNDALAIARDSERVFLGTDTAWLELDTLGPDPEVTSLDAEENLSLPVRTDNSTVTAEDGQVWFNDGSGPDAAGVYYYDENSQIVGPVGEGAGSAPASLSGLQIDTTKDFDGFSLTGLGHDEVDVPQTFDLVTDDFERASLGSDYVGDTQDAQIQSAVALEGSRSLEISRSSSGRSTIAYRVDEAPQFGDSFEHHVYLTGTDDRAVLSLFAARADDILFGGTGTIIRVGAEFDTLFIESSVNGTTQNSDVTNADVSNNLNETLTLSGEVSSDGVLSVELTNASGTELATVSHTIPDRIPESGAIKYSVRNRNTGGTVYHDGPFIKRRLGEETRERQRGSTETSKLQTRGGVGAGPPTATPNQRRRTVHRHPVTTDAQQGQRYVDAQTVGGSPVAYVEGRFDGNGGSYADRLNAPSGRLTRVNTNLSWEYDTLSSVPHWGSVDNGDSTYTFNVNDRPRRIHVEHDGSASGIAYGGVVSNTLTTYQSLGAFRVTFHDVSFTRNSGDNWARFGVTDDSPSSDLDATGNSFYIAVQGPNDSRVVVVDNGNVTRAGGNLTVDWTQQHDVIVEYDGSQMRGYVDGELDSSLSYSVNADFSPFIQLRDDFENSTGEVTEVGFVTVEPLTEVLR